MMSRLNDIEGVELSREKVELSQGMFCDLVEYDIQNYGHALCAENMEMGSLKLFRGEIESPLNT